MRRAPYLDGISRILFRKHSLRRQPFLFPRLASGEPLARLREPSGCDYYPGASGFRQLARRPAPCSVLHRRRFFVPRHLRAGRWALTPPFHPYPRCLSARRRFVFCDTVRDARLSPNVPAHSTRHGAWRCSDFPLHSCPRSDHRPPEPTLGARCGRDKPDMKIRVSAL